VTRNSKEKKKNVNRKCLATRSKRQAKQTASQAPTKRQPGALVTNHLAVTGHRWAVAASFAPVWWLAPGGETLPPGALFR